jgi:hypothetical protein
VSDLNRRLARLEAAATTGGRCAVCRDWPGHRVEYVNDPYQRPNRPDGPDRCPACGWEVTVIRIEYVEDWRMTNERGGLPPGRATWEQDDEAV